MKLLSLFSGIGAVEEALKILEVDTDLVGFSEIDKYAIKSYCTIHEVSENKNLGDITKIDIEKLPMGIDLISHGSPCQDFSVAGLQKGGDEGSGTKSSLMWNTVDIVKYCMPKFVIWENVKNVLSKKHKHNFDKYLEEMDRIGYNNFYQILNAKDYGVPQSRERVFVVSIRKDIEKDFKFPKGFDNGIRLKDILEDKVDEKYYINTEKANKLIEEFKANNKNIADNENCPKVICPCITPGKLNIRQGRRFKTNNEPMFTLTTQDRHGILEINTLNFIDGIGEKDIIVNEYRIRKLTPKECWRLMGFNDESFYKASNVCSNTQLYKQAGNSIVVNVLIEIFKNLLF